MPIQIFNARLGFANNSSSLHSMIFLRGAPDDDHGDYGWSEFTLSSRESKMGYLARILFDQLSRDADPACAALVVRQLFSDRLDPNWTPSASVDHQSVFELPTYPDGKGVNLEFAREFSDWLLDESLVVLGGNDNSDEPHPLLGDAVDQTPFSREVEGYLSARKDPASGSWTLFNKSNGAKLRMVLIPGKPAETFGADGRPADAFKSWDSDSDDPPKSSLPELADVKITDHCAFGCAFCYQNSTPKGRHAALEDIRKVARELLKAGVLEVALGGGEPTSHPQFPEVLEAFSELGMTVNFTTRDLGFMKDPELRARILAAASSIAFSVDRPGQMTEVAELWKAAGGASWENPFAFQHVVGTASDEDFAAIVAESVGSTTSAHKLTLLGFKTTGRGGRWLARSDAADRAKAQSLAWIPIAEKAMGKQSGWRQIGIDTALARECEAQFGEKKIPRFLWHKSEGLVSFYVDAVAMAFAKSSYEAEGASEPFGPGWLERFASWTPTASNQGPRP